MLFDDKTPMGFEPISAVLQTAVFNLWTTGSHYRPRETRTLTDGFGDRNATITPSAYINDNGGIRTLMAN